MHKGLHAARGLFVCALYIHAALSERPCSYGRFRQTPGLACVSCPENHVFNEIKSGTTPANPCVCRGGFTGLKNTSTGSVTCVMCQAGQYSDETNTCQQCAIGTYASFAGQTACTSCQSPQFCDNGGCTRCTSPSAVSLLQCEGPRRQIRNTDDFSLYKSFSKSKI